MIAFDTNLLVRIAIKDDLRQLEIVQKLLLSETVFISRTVLLETEWVLRARYGFSRERMADFFALIVTADRTEIENQVIRALDGYRLGADFADALHLAVSGMAIMHTFDQSFCKAAWEQGLTPEVRVLRT